MSVKYKIIDQNGLNYLTLTTVGWIDLFTRQVYREIVIDSLKYCIENKGLSVHGYTIMSNHLHLIASVETPFELSDVLRDFKAHTARTILKYLKDKNNPESRREWLLYLFGYFAFGRKDKQELQVWQHDNHPIELFTDKVTFQKLDYIHQNAVRADLVELPEHWKYSSAGFYKTGTGVLDIVVLRSIYEIET
jgi:putative transposase